MKNLTSMFFLLTLTFATTHTIAGVNIVECEDEQGNRSFQKTCPPGSTMVSEKRFNTGASTDTSTKQQSIRAIVYLVPDCDACDEAKEFLSGRNIQTTEKNVKDDLELQAELTELVGALKVPTTVIGDEVLTGYSRSSYIAALEAAGHSEEEP